MGLKISLLDLVSVGRVLVETLEAEIGGDTLGTVAGVVSKTGEEVVLMEESKSNKTDKGSKVTNQGWKAGRDEEGEEDTESKLDKDGNTNSWKMQWGEI